MACPFHVHEWTLSAVMIRCTIRGLEMINLWGVRHFVSELYILIFECGNALLQSSNGFISKNGVYCVSRSGGVVHCSGVGARSELFE